MWPEKPGAGRASPGASHCLEPVAGGGQQDIYDLPQSDLCKPTEFSALTEEVGRKAPQTKASLRKIFGVPSPSPGCLWKDGGLIG